MMNLLGNVHLVAGGEETLPALEAFLKKEGIRMRGNPDVYMRTYMHFGVDEAREIRERASARALVEHARIFIVVAPHMTAEAQNALLKVLEEPTGDALFFLLVPAPEALLPTLRSRAQRLEFSSKERVEKNHMQVDMGKFLSATPEKRLEMLSPLLEKQDDERRDLGAILAFLSALEENLHGHEGLKAIYRARKYATDKGALLKPLLEQVALLLPRV